MSAFVDDDMCPSDDDCWNRNGEIVPMKRCGNKNNRTQWQCKRMLPVSDDRVRCQECLAAKSRWSKSEKGKIHFKRRNSLIESKEAIEKWRRENKMMFHMTIKLNQMVKGEHPGPVTFPRLGLFSSNEDAEAHFRSLFKPWMTMENHGKHCAGNGYNVVWNIGHRLPRAIFDGDNEEDLKRCWNRRNLFPQCARENLENNSKLTIPDSELLRLRQSWPVAAMDDLNQLKKLFKRRKVG